MMKYSEKPQLRMIWPTDRVEGVPLNTPRGYVIRTYRAGDEVPFMRLMAEGDFDPWDDAKLQHNKARIIPGGWFFVVEKESDSVVGTAMCIHNYSECTPFHWGRWLAGV